MLLLCFMMIITPIQLLEAKKKRGGKKKRGRKKKRDHIVDERIDKVMQFSEQLVKDGHLFDGIQLVQTVWQQLKLPLYKKMKLKHRHSIEQLLKKYKYQNKSLYTLVKQTVCIINVTIFFKTFTCKNILLTLPVLIIYI